MRAQRSRPTRGDERAASDLRAAGSVVPIVAPPTDIATLTPRARAVWDEAYELGCTAGWVRGWDAAHEQTAAIHRHAFAVVQDAARQPSFAELCELRGEPGRAAAQVRLLRGRGIA